MIHQAEQLLQEFVNYVKDETNQPDVLSLYLVVDPALPTNQASTPGWKIWQKNALADIDGRVTDRDERSRWNAISHRAEQFLADYSPSSKTLMLFVSPERELALELPIRLENRAHYGWPQVKQFMWALDEHQEYLVVLLAQDKARTIHLFLDRSFEDTTISLDVDITWGRRENRLSAHEANIAQRKDELDSRFARQVAAELNDVFLKHPNIERMIFAGNQRLAHAVHNAMHPSAAAQVIAVLNIPYDTPDDVIATQVADVARAFERENEIAIVQDVITRARTGRRGALGTADVTEALDRQAVRLLVLPYPFDPALADELLAKAVWSSSNVEFVHGEAASMLKEAGGIGAHLYYQV
jgi:hypothetical protein